MTRIIDCYYNVTSKEHEYQIAGKWYFDIQDARLSPGWAVIQYGTQSYNKLIRIGEQGEPIFPIDEQQENEWKKERGTRS